jgi:PKD repeat protein
LKRGLMGLVAVVAVAIAGIVVTASGASAAILPQAVPGGPYSAYLGNVIQFDGTASSGVGLTYSWTFGDGTSATGAQPVKTYAAAGTYTVTLTVTDNVGNQSVAATTATVLGYGSVNTSGCYISVYGTLVCGQTASSVVSGCYLTINGWVCPQYGVTYPGQIVNSVVYPSSLGSICNDPNYARTPFCLDT